MSWYFYIGNVHLCRDYLCLCFMSRFSKLIKQLVARTQCSSLPAAETEGIYLTLPTCEVPLIPPLCVELLSLWTTWIYYFPSKLKPTLDESVCLSSSTQKQLWVEPRAAEVMLLLQEPLCVCGSERLQAARHAVGARSRGSIYYQTAVFPLSEINPSPLWLYLQPGDKWFVTMGYVTSKSWSSYSLTCSGLQSHLATVMGEYYKVWSAPHLGEIYIDTWCSMTGSSRKQLPKSSFENLIKVA